MDGPDVSQTTTRISVDVINTIAAVTERDPLTMNPPLYDVIDTDALDRLFEQSDSASVEFEYDGHEVHIDSEGTVRVDGERGPF